MSMMSEFREFAMKGNVLDLAIGVVIGAAFGKIVTALVDGIIMPLIGMVIGGFDLSEAAVVLKAGQFDAAGREIAAPVLLKYGLFLQNTLDFIIIAFAIFMVVKAVNRLRRKQEESPSADDPAPAADVALLTEIRDLLRVRAP